MDIQYCRQIKIKELNTINGCSAINNKVIDAELVTDDGGGKIITIENPNNSLKVMAMQPSPPKGIYNLDGIDYSFEAKKTWIWTTEKGLSIQL